MDINQQQHNNNNLSFVNETVEPLLEYIADGRNLSSWPFSSSLSVSSSFPYSVVSLKNNNLRTLSTLPEGNQVKLLDLSHNLISNIDPSLFTTSLSSTTGASSVSTKLVSSTSVTVGGELLQPYPSNYHSLQSLCLADNRLVSINKLTYLSKYLIYLDLADNFITNINILPSLRYLRYLGLSGNSISTYVHLQDGFQELRILDLQKNQLTSLPYTKNLPSLKICLLDDQRIISSSSAGTSNDNNNTAVAAVGFTSTSLVHLRIRDNLLNDNVFASLPPLRSIISADIDGNRLSNLEYISKVLPNVLHLSLRRNKLQPFRLNTDNSSSSSSSTIKSIVINSTQEHQKLNVQPLLQTLKLCFNPIEDISIFRSCTHIQRLYLSHCSIRNFPQIPEWSQSLQILDLNYNKLNDTSLHGLNNLPKLAALRLRGNHIKNDQTIIQYCNAAAMPFLVELDIRENPFHPSRLRTDLNDPEGKKISSTTGLHKSSYASVGSSLLSSVLHPSLHSNLLSSAVTTAAGVAFVDDTPLFRLTETATVNLSKYGSNGVLDDDNNLIYYPPSIDKNVSTKTEYLNTGLETSDTLISLSYSLPSFPSPSLVEHSSNGIDKDVENIGLWRTQLSRSLSNHLLILDGFSLKNSNHYNGTIDQYTLYTSTLPSPAVTASIQDPATRNSIVSPNIHSYPLSSASLLWSPVRPNASSVLSNLHNNKDLPQDSSGLDTTNATTITSNHQRRLSLQDMNITPDKRPIIIIKPIEAKKDVSVDRTSPSVQGRRIGETGLPVAVPPVDHYSNNNNSSSSSNNFISPMRPPKGTGTKKKEEIGIEIFVPQHSKPPEKMANVLSPPTHYHPSNNTDSHVGVPPANLVFRASQNTANVVPIISSQPAAKPKQPLHSLPQDKPVRGLTTDDIVLHRTSPGKSNVVMMMVQNTERRISIDSLDSRNFPDNYRTNYVPPIHNERSSSPPSLGSRGFPLMGTEQVAIIENRRNVFPVPRERPTVRIIQETMEPIVEQTVISTTENFKTIEQTEEKSSIIQTIIPMQEPIPQKVMQHSVSVSERSSRLDLLPPSSTTSSSLSSIESAVKNVSAMWIRKPEIIVPSLPVVTIPKIIPTTPVRVMDTSTSSLGPMSPSEVADMIHNIMDKETANLQATIVKSIADATSSFKPNESVKPVKDMVTTGTQASLMVETGIQSDNHEETIPSTASKDQIMELLQSSHLNSESFLSKPVVTTQSVGTQASLCLDVGIQASWSSDEEEEKPHPKSRSAKKIVTDSNKEESDDDKDSLGASSPVKVSLRDEQLLTSFHAASNAAVVELSTRTKEETANIQAATSEFTALAKTEAAAIRSATMQAAAELSAASKTEAAAILAASSSAANEFKTVTETEIAMLHSATVAAVTAFSNVAKSEAASLQVASVIAANEFVNIAKKEAANFHAASTSATAEIIAAATEIRAVVRALSSSAVVSESHQHPLTKEVAERIVHSPADSIAGDNESIADSLVDDEDEEKIPSVKMVPNEVKVPSKTLPPAVKLSTSDLSINEPIRTHFFHSYTQDGYGTVFGDVLQNDRLRLARAITKKGMDDDIDSKTSRVGSMILALSNSLQRAEDEIVHAHETNQQLSMTQLHATPLPTVTVPPPKPPSVPSTASSSPSTVPDQSNGLTSSDLQYLNYSPDSKFSTVSKVSGAKPPWIPSGVAPIGVHKLPGIPHLQQVLSASVLQPSFPTPAERSQSRERLLRPLYDHILLQAEPTELSRSRNRITHDQIEHAYSKFSGSHTHQNVRPTTVTRQQSIAKRSAQIKRTVIAQPPESTSRSSRAIQKSSAVQQRHRSSTSRSRDAQYQQTVERAIATKLSSDLHPVHPRVSTIDTTTTVKQNVSLPPQSLQSNHIETKSSLLLSQPNPPPRIPMPKTGLTPALGRQVSAILEEIDSAVRRLKFTYNPTDEEVEEEA